jgi:probable F420-dependent oxidoreductase
VRVGLALARSLTSSRSVATSLAVRAEELGYHSLWVGEHIAMPVQWKSRYPFTEDGVAPFDHRVAYTDAMVTLAYLAGVTERIRLGSAVVPIITRDPLSLAKQAATLDIVSDGRLELGLGAGWLLEEAVALGHPSDHPSGRLAETIAVLRRAWTEEAFEYRGRFYDFDAVAVHPQPVQQPVPIWIGGVSPKLLAIAAEMADGVIVPARSQSQTIEMVRDVAERLPAGREIAVITLLSGERQADRAYADGLRAAGATLLIAQVSLDPETAMAQLDGFADFAAEGVDA